MDRILQMKSCTQLHSAHSCLPGILTFTWTLTPLITHQSLSPQGQATWHEDTCNLSVFPIITPPNSDHHGAVCTKSILKAQRSPHILCTDQASLHDPVLPVYYPIPSPTPELANRAQANLMSPIYTFPNLQVRPGGTAQVPAQCAVSISDAQPTIEDHTARSHIKII